MTKDIVKGYDNEIILRIKNENGSYFNLASHDPDRERDLLGIRIYLFSKFRDVVMRFGMDIDGDEWNVLPNLGRITNEDSDKGIISIKVLSDDTDLFYDGPYYLRGTLIFEDVNFPDNYHNAINDELLHCGYVIGENVGVGSETSNTEES